MVAGLDDGEQVQRIGVVHGFFGQRFDRVVDHAVNGGATVEP
jgi:hypothetical protein